MKTGERWSGTRFAWLLLVLPMLHAPGCAKDRASVEKNLMAQQSALRNEGVAEHYRVGCPDVVELEMPDRPEFAGKYEIGPDGRIDLGDYGKLRIEGRTPPDIVKLLARGNRRKPGNHAGARRRVSQPASFTFRRGPRLATQRPLSRPGNGARPAPARRRHHARRRAEGRLRRATAFARYKNIASFAAVVVEIEVDEEISLKKVWCAADAGLVIAPDGARNQIEGGIIQGASFAMREQVRFEDGRVATQGWNDYPILRFSDVPEIEIELIDNPNEPTLGLGEASVGPTGAAIGNALGPRLGQTRPRFAADAGEDHGYAAGRVTKTKANDREAAMTSFLRRLSSAGLLLAGAFAMSCRRRRRN